MKLLSSLWQILIPNIAIYIISRNTSTFKSIDVLGDVPITICEAYIMEIWRQTLHIICVEIFNLFSKNSGDIIDDKQNIFSSHTHIYIYIILFYRHTLHQTIYIISYYYFILLLYLIIIIIVIIIWYLWVIWQQNENEVVWYCSEKIWTLNTHQYLNLCFKFFDLEKNMDKMLLLRHFGGSMWFPVSEYNSFSCWFMM